MVQAIHGGTVKTMIKNNRLEILVSAVNKDVLALSDTMNLQSDLLLLRQPEDS